MQRPTTYPSNPPSFQNVISYLRKRFSKLKKKSMRIKEIYRIFPKYEGESRRIKEGEHFKGQSRWKKIFHAKKKHERN